MREIASTIATGGSGIAGSLVALANAPLPSIQVVAVIAGIVVSVLMAIKLALEIRQIWRRK